jgi:hypothetical protein
MRCPWALQREHSVHFFFDYFLLSGSHTFLPEVVFIDYKKFHGILNIRIALQKKLGPALDPALCFIWLGKGGVGGGGVSKVVLRFRNLAWAPYSHCFPVETWIHLMKRNKIELFKVAYNL